MAIALRCFGCWKPMPTGEVALECSACREAAARAASETPHRCVAACWEKGFCAKEG